MSEPTAPPVELAVDERVKTRLAALLEVTTLDFRAMALAADLDPATSFRGKRIRGVDFGESDLTGFDFSGADLTGCDFSRTETEGAIFTGACRAGVRGLEQQPDETRVFISFTGADRETATLVAEGLHRHGINCYIEDERIGSSIYDVIRDELRQATHFLLIASPRSIKSRWVNAEIEFALDRSINQKLIFIPALLELSAGELPASLQKFAAVDLSYLHTAIDHIAGGIFKRKPRHMPTLPAPSYDNSRELVEQLIRDELHDRFNDFHPGHYGYDLHKVYLEDIKRDGDRITAVGSISATAHLGASSDEDGINVDYHSRFEAIFTVFPPEDGIEGIDLDQLTLEKTDWFEHEPDQDDETTKIADDDEEPGTLPA